VKSLVPAYIWAGYDHLWDQLIQQQPAAVIVNPNSGPPAARDRAFGRVLERLAAANIPAYGYVAMGWLRASSSVSATAAKAIERWHRSSPPIAGIFIDEAPTRTSSRTDASFDALIRRCIEIDRQARAESPGVILNPGTIVDPEWFDRWPQALWCTFEGSADTFLRTTRPPGPGDAQAALVYGCRDGRHRRRVIDHARSRGWTWSTATSGTLPNPWCTVDRTRLPR
jgi:hypothetical protein